MTLGMQALFLALGAFALIGVFAGIAAIGLWYLGPEDPL